MASSLNQGFLTVVHFDLLFQCPHFEECQIYRKIGSGDFCTQLKAFECGG
jgi:hypothetical protein